MNPCLAHLITLLTSDGFTIKEFDEKSLKFEGLNKSGRWSELSVGTSNEWILKDVAGPDSPSRRLDRAGYDSLVAGRNQRPSNCPIFNAYLQVVHYQSRSISASHYLYDRFLKFTSKNKEKGNGFVVEFDEDMTLDEFSQLSDFAGP